MSLPIGFGRHASPWDGAVPTRGRGSGREVLATRQHTVDHVSCSPSTVSCPPSIDVEHTSLREWHALRTTCFVYSWRVCKIVSAALPFVSAAALGTPRSADTRTYVVLSRCEGSDANLIEVSRLLHITYYDMLNYPPLFPGSRTNGVLCPRERANQKMLQTVKGSMLQ